MPFDRAATQRTNIYVDGFNLYYRALKRRPEYKWLDIRALCRDLLDANNDIRRIWYFTANASGWKDPDLPVRQTTYLKALETLPEVRIKKGNFQSGAKWAPLARNVGVADLFSAPPEYVKIHKTEEKGSDVNLATQLVADAFRDEFDVGVVISNDTDLCEPIRVVAKELRKPVGIICPDKDAATSLKKIATFLIHITPSRLANAQFPDVIPGTLLRRPATWIAKKEPLSRA